LPQIIILAISPAVLLNKSTSQLQSSHLFSLFQPLPQAATTSMLSILVRIKNIPSNKPVFTF